MLNQINNENSKTWNGKIALATASEYIRSNSNQGSCGNMDQLWNLSSCGNTTWMHNGTMWWTFFVFYVATNGYFYNNLDYGFPDTSRGVRPVLYISADVQITGGDGSQSNPYTIS